MTSESSNLLLEATNAKMKYMAGIISYSELVDAATKYIDHCNEVAERLAKEYGMKPKKMSVKAWLR